MSRKSLENPRSRRRPLVFRARQAGQIILAFTLVLPVLLIMTGLVMDGGRLIYQRRRAQVAADAGARGAANELLRGRNSQAQLDEAARTDAKLNGFDHDADGTTVTAELGPAGYDNGFVAVTVTDEVPTTFMRVASILFGTVSARAIAGILPDDDSPCVLALNETASGAITMSGSALLRAGCKVMSNSNSPSSLLQNGSGACIDARKIGFVKDGDFVTNGGVNCLIPTPQGFAIPARNPLDYLGAPSTSGVTQQSAPLYVVNEGNVAMRSPLEPGYYRQGIQISSANSVDVWLNPGVYYVDGFTATGNVTLRGEGVTIIDMCGSGPLTGIRVAGTVDAALTAPTSGTYENVLFYSACAESNIDVTGTAGSTYEGIIYAPDSNIHFGGNQVADPVWGMIIGDTISFAGDPHMTINFSGTNRTSTVTRVGMVF